MQLLNDKKADALHGQHRWVTMPAISHVSNDWKSQRKGYESPISKDNNSQIKLWFLFFWLKSNKMQDNYDYLVYFL